MILQSLSTQILLALLGGMAAELLHWYALSRRPRRLPQYQRPVYWITTAGMVILGGFMPVLYIQGPAPALLCFHLGAATPVIVQKLVANLPALASTQGEEEVSLQSFFRW